MDDAHVVDNLRKVRSVIEGGAVKIVEFDDASIVKELVEKGRRVGEMKMDAKIIKYSNADDGHDLALLMVRAKDYAKDGVDFYLKEKMTESFQSEQIYFMLVRCLVKWVLIQ